MRTFQPGETKVRPGVYFRIENVGGTEPGVTPSGIVAALVKASWGPPGTVRVIEGGLTELESVYGANVSRAAKEAIRGGAARLLTVRLGSDGQHASTVLTDTSETAVDVVRLQLRYPGDVPFSVTVRDSLADDTKRELILYRGTTKVQTVLFDKGTNEPQALVDALADSPWVIATKLADGDGQIADVTQQAFSGGQDPQPTAEDVTSALALLERESWNVLIVDSEDPAIHASIQAFIDRLREEGKRVMGVVGESTSVPLDTRLTNAASFNDPAIVYVVNGFQTSAGEVVEGAAAAGRVAGMVASAPITASLTHAVVQGAVSVVGALTSAEIERCIQAGALCFTTNAAGQVQIEYGITTFVTPTADLDAGWKKIRRVRTRDALIERILAAWDPLTGKVANSPDGRATLVAVANGVIAQMVAEGALLDGRVEEDPARPPAGDSAWFRAVIQDLDSAEKLYLVFGFQFSAAS